jgi:Cupredoxin-like domain
MLKKNIINCSALLFMVVIINNVAIGCENHRKKQESTQVQEIVVLLKDHKFVPETTELISGKKYKLIIDNQDKEDEEFDSDDLGKEQFVKGGQKIILEIGPLEQGKYEFAGEMNKSAKGVIVVK